MRRALGAIYRQASDIAEAMYAAKGQPRTSHRGAVSAPDDDRRASVGPHGRRAGDPGALPAPAVDAAGGIAGAGDASPPRAEIAYAERIRGSSIYPAVQNIILACRALGLGTTITTNHIRCEDAVRALLRLPDDVDSFAMMPIGWPMDLFGPLSRRPLPEVVHADGWGNAWPGGLGAP